MRLSKEFFTSPQLEFGSISGSGNATKNGAGGSDSDLWDQQQVMLSSHRARLCELSKQLKEGRDCGKEIRNTYEMLAGKMHVADWPALLPVFDALGVLGDEYHQGAVILGGWHHQGDLSKLSPPPQAMLVELREYRQLLQARALRNNVANGILDAATKLEAHLNLWPKIFPRGLANRPDELRDFIAQRSTQLTQNIETELLFLQQRVLLFGATAKSATAGWSDFALFVRAYRYLVKQFTSQFGDYFWGVYPPRVDRCGGGAVARGFGGGEGSAMSVPRSNPEGPTTRTTRGEPPVGTSEKTLPCGATGRY